ncbi:unnamed protein product [Paramecium primaurelia]|uniref:Trichocyst matrix protein n=1 Tax=Paramecium primaurelia TaxID=5886 RepID=A0A8S1PZD5_PARPR|nr:unnamed protein product [Paramecium primaurelia]
MKIIAFLCVVIAFSSATEAIDIFNTLPKTDFGKTILQTVQLELSNGSAVDSVVQSLNEILKSAEQEKGAIQTNLRNRQTQCQTRQDDAQSIIDRANAKRADDERKLPLINEELISKQEQALVKDSEEQRNNDKLALITATREQQKQEYQDRRNELTNYVAALGEAKSIVSGLGSVSFLQVSSNEHYSKFKEANPTPRGYGIMVELLLKASTQAKTPEQVERIVATIQGLIDSIYELQKQELLVDDAREVEFIRQREILLLANQTLAASVAQLKAQVLHLQQDIVEVTNDVNTNKSIASIKTKELNDWIKTCQDEEKNLRAIFDSRVGQVETVNQILIIFNSGLSQELRKSIAEIQLN